MTKEYGENEPHNLTGNRTIPQPVRAETTPPHYLIQFFAWEHLPEHLRHVSRRFGLVAKIMDNELPDNPEKTTALRKLLEAKDCAVRAVLFKQAGG